MRMEEDKSKYAAAKHATIGIAKALEDEHRNFGEKMNEEDRKGTVFRVAKQIVRKNREVVGGGCIIWQNGRRGVGDDGSVEKSL